MKHHDLRSFPTHFEAVVNGSKTFETRRNDRDFQLDDTVTLHEYYYDHGDHYTGRTFSGVIGYVDTFAQQDGYVVFSLKQRGALIIK